MATLQKPHPTAKGIAELFDTSSPLTTPLIQRSYAWREKEVADYWRDLSDARTRGRYHFLGLIVVDQSRRIHDGQQRLATTYLFIQEIKSQLERCSPGLTEEEADDIGPDRLAAALTSALEGKKKKPSMPLMIGKGDQVVLIDPATGISVATESAGRLVAARGSLRAKLVNELDALPDDSARVRTLWSWWEFLTEKACVVELTVSAQTANSIFETLNKRGVQLSVSDVIKSYLLATLDDSRQDEGVAIWVRITSTLRKETALNEFLLHYWGSHHGQITRAQLYEALKDQVDDKSSRALVQLKSYEKDSLLYAALRNPDDSLWIPYRTEVVDAIRLINALQLTQLRYLLLAILREYPKGITDAKKRRRSQAEALRWLGAWAVRGVVTNRTGGKPAETAYISAAIAVREGAATRSEDIRAIFVDAGRTVSDSAFKDAFAKASLNATATKLIVYAFEVKLTGEDTPLGPKPRLTREHVLPQSPNWSTSNWKHFSRQEHADYVERLGNILLLTGVTNRELGNQGWTAKKNVILRKGVLQLPLTEEALTEPDWTTDVIDRRQQAMAELAVELWPS